MNNDVRWLIHLGIHQKLFSREQCQTIVQKLGEGVCLMDFAQQLIDDGIVGDVDRLEGLGTEAMAKAADGEAPAFNGPGAKPAQGNDTLKTSSSERDTVPPFIDQGPPPDFDFTGLSEFTEAGLERELRQFLRDAAHYGASDLHLSAGAKPFLRRNRALINLSEQPLSADDALRLNTVLLASHQRQVFLERRDFDYALALDNENRYRVNLMFHKQGAAGSYRMVPARIPRLPEIGLRDLAPVHKFLSYHNGLILVTGPVGAGKTTTLAALVAELNETREDHIITIEDPIEVVQPSRKCNVTQREVGPHTKSFASALKGALREDPDVIVIGELRDLETIEMAITAAETGHLVIGTMHTSDAATTLNRLLDVFPSAQQPQIRASVAESLRGIICQRLLPKAKGGLVLASEILVANSAVSNLIREGKTQGLRNTMETGLKDGMCLMESVIFELWQKQKITAATARANINNRMIRAKITV
ncbi:MAG: PilT/PilU family type 4a pilus ATPase [Nibricoccus sp.]